MNETKQVQQGMRIENRYRIVREIAEGGMATVYQAEDERLQRPVAIKIMHTQLAQGVHREQFIARFRREATSAAAISNPHIVQVYDTGEYEGLDYLVMEYVHGVNLRYEMNTQGTFSVRDTLRVLAQTLDGLASAHQTGVVHRDIKPENILINDRGNVQITDFGLARVISQATLSSTGLLLGTAAYLAPEMIEHNLATPQGDLYSAGMMAWEMLAGHVPFRADNPVTLVFKHVHENTPSIVSACPDINPQVAQFLEQLTQRDMNLRPSNAGEALTLLRKVSTQLTQEEWRYRLELPEKSESSSQNDTNPLNINITSTRNDDHAHNNEHDTDFITAHVQQNTFDRSMNTTSDMDETISVPVANNRFVPPENSPLDDPNTAALPSHTLNAVNDTELDAFNDSDAPTIAIRQSQHSTDHQSSVTITQNADTSPTTKHTSRKKAVLIWLSIVLSICAVALIGCYWYFFGPGSYWSLPKPDALSCEHKEVCKITRIRWADYERTLKVAGIPYKVHYAYHDDIAAQSIIATDPQAVGARISKHRNNPLQVFVSRGVKQATIPTDILNPDSYNGKHPVKALRHAGFTNLHHRSSLDIYSLEVPEGAVLEISPKPGTTMNHNKSVTLLLSKGPMPVSMPDIINHTKVEALQALENAKLKVTFEQEYSDTVEANKVLSTSVKKGDELHWGDSVTVVLSRGPKMVTIPDVRGKNSQDAKRIIEGLNLRVRIVAPLGDYMHIVRFQNPAPGQQFRLRDKNGEPSTVTLTVI